MNKKILPIILAVLILSFSSIASLVLVNSYFVDSNGEGNDAYAIVQQGESVNYRILISSNTGTIGYKVWMYENGQSIDLIPHTVLQGINTTDSIENLDTSTFSLGGHTIMVSGNDDGSNSYSMTESLYLFVLPGQGGNNPPYVPSNPYPATGSEDIRRDVTLSWTGGDPDNDVVYYDIYFGKVGQSMVLIEDDTEVSSFSFENLLDYDTNYNWKVVASDNLHGPVSGPIWTFSTIGAPQEGNNPPNVPQYINPIDGATNIETSVNFLWQGYDPDGDILSYDFWFGTSEDNLELVSGNLDMESFFKTNLEYSTKYYWKVVAKDNEYQTSGDVWEFTTKQEIIVDDNHNPIIQSIEDKKVECGKTFRLDVDATDIDGDVLHYYDNTDLFQIDENTGLISFKASCSDRGTYLISITVTDDFGGKAGETFKLKIYRDSDNDEDDELVSVGFNNILVPGQCMDNFDGDNVGIREVVSKILDSRGNVLSLQTFNEPCILTNEDFAIYQFKGFEEDSVITMLLVALIFLLITVPLSVYIFNKIS